MGKMVLPQVQTLRAHPFVVDESRIRIRAKWEVAVAEIGWPAEQVHYCPCNWDVMYSIIYQHVTNPVSSYIYVGSVDRICPGVSQPLSWLLILNSPSLFHALLCKGRSSAARTRFQRNQAAVAKIQCKNYDFGLKWKLLDTRARRKKWQMLRMKLCCRERHFGVSGPVNPVTLKELVAAAEKQRLDVGAASGHVGYGRWPRFAGKRSGVAGEKLLVHGEKSRIILVAQTIYSSPSKDVPKDAQTPVLSEKLAKMSYTLTFSQLVGEFVTDKELLGAQDPYVIFEAGSGKKCQTKVPYCYSRVSTAADRTNNGVHL